MPLILIQSPEFAKIKSLDDKIQDILSNKNIPESDKAQLYSIAASEYINLRNKAPETMKTYFNPPVFQSEKETQISEEKEMQTEDEYGTPMATDDEEESDDEGGDLRLEQI